MKARITQKALLFLALFVPLLFLAACSKQNAQDSKVQSGPTESEKSDIIRLACKEDRIDIHETARTPDLYVDYRYLPVVMGLQIRNRPGRLRLPVTHSDIVKYMLSTGWTAIETERERYLAIDNGPGESSKVVRFALMPEGAAACKAFDTQYSDPLHTVSELRELGVPPDQCVGIFELPAPTAKGQIQVARQRLFVDPKDSSSYHWRVDVTANVVNEGQAVRQTGVAVQHMGVGATGQHGDGAFIPCAGRTSHPLLLRCDQRARGNCDRLNS